MYMAIAETNLPTGAYQQEMPTLNNVETAVFPDAETPTQ
jgi:hypothetical protein